MDLDLAGIGQFLFDLLCNISCQQDHFVFANLLRLDHYADLASSLNGIGALDAGEGLGDFLQLFKALDVVLDILAAGTGSACGLSETNS